MQVYIELKSRTTRLFCSWLTTAKKKKELISMKKRKKRKYQFFQNNKQHIPFFFPNRFLYSVFLHQYIPIHNQYIYIYIYIYIPLCSLIAKARILLTVMMHYMSNVLGLVEKLTTYTCMHLHFSLLFFFLSFESVCRSQI